MDRSDSRIDARPFNPTESRLKRVTATSWTRLFKELIHGLNTGIVVWEGGHPLCRGETDIQTVLSALLGK